MARTETWLCPKDGTALVPSRRILADEWRDCPTCGALIGLPDMRNADDLGVFLGADTDFDSDPNRQAGMIRSSMEQHPGGSRNGRKRGKKSLKGKGRPRYLDDSTVLPARTNTK